MNSNYKYSFLLLLIIGLASSQVSLIGQGFLKADGQRIVNGTGENLILKGIGTGNWMLQEGYMMKSSGIAGTMHEFKANLEESIGIERTEEFYDSWLSNHFTKTDVDSMARWGFNSIRVAIHYKWFTLPIEEEPVIGEQTWLTKGFSMLDSLLSWCEANSMYLIIDLHGAPGGQGANADISDYDDSKPSLWGSDLNKEKTIELWTRLAERYHDKNWIGGYDLLNEVNWTFPEGNNSQLKNLYTEITSAIRAVDQNHIIFIEGNGFANDFSGLTPPWDPNMAYSFHKYWTYNHDSALDWVLELREQYNVPLWLGESGENSNTWFTNLVSLCESNNIGWSWWPVKKTGNNNILSVNDHENYDRLIQTWDGNGAMSADQAYQAVMRFSENHRFENCEIKYDVIDALIRQPNSTESKAFKNHVTGNIIFAVDYDLGRNNVAYFDQDTADYHLETNSFTAWNQGWQYRSDGVDIELCSDEEVNNGYSVGWIRKDEWLHYTVDAEQLGAYKMILRAASKDSWKMHVEVDGKIATKTIVMQGSGGNDIWNRYEIENIILPIGSRKVKIVFESDDVNFNYFTLSEPKPVEEIPLLLLAANTHVTNNDLFLHFNKAISNQSEEIQVSDFQLIVNNALMQIDEIEIPFSNDHQIVISAASDLFSTDNVRLTYRGNTINSNGQFLDSFTASLIENKIHPHFDLPGLIQAEEFMINRGFTLEDCTDLGGGQNLAYADEGDYVDYLVNFSQSGEYKIDFRVAAKYNSPDIILMKWADDKMVPFKVVRFNATGDWQNWQTQSTTATFEAGKTIFRIYSRNGEHNLNWFSFGINSGIKVFPETSRVTAYPNPASNKLYIEFGSSNERLISLYNLNGKLLLRTSSNQLKLQFDIQDFSTGQYILHCMDGKEQYTTKLVIAR